jgi:rare lipoprotein A
MLRGFRLPLLLFAASLAGCATHTPPVPPQAPVAFQPPPPAPAPQAAEIPRPEPAVPPLAATAAPFFQDTGLASFYGRKHAGKRTASGERFDHRDFTAAHRTLAFGTLLRVTNLSNGRAVTVQITDRGPHIKTRIIDISLAAAQALHMQAKGIARVKLEAFREDQPRGGLTGRTAFSGDEPR